MSGYMANAPLSTADLQSDGSPTWKAHSSKISMVSASETMLLSSHDENFRKASSSVDGNLARIDYTATLQQAEDMFKHIMDPKNKDTKKLIEKLFDEPMNAITKKLLEAVEAISVDNLERAGKHIKLVREILELSKEVRDTALDHVYENMERLRQSFSGAIDIYNEKMKATVVQALELYRARIETEIDVRQKMLHQKMDEHKHMLEAATKENDTMIANQQRYSQAQTEINERRLEEKKRRDAREHERELKALERADKRAQHDLQVQQKKAEALHKEQEQKIERMMNKDQADYERVVKELDTKSKRGQLDRDERDGILKEFEIEMARYRVEWNLANEAMRQALARGTSSCKIVHTAPRIEWKPPRVIPGHISWDSTKP